MPKKENKRFAFNDESQYNTYGFRVANGGIDLSRFKLNPVMLNGHWASNENVIGRWDGVKIVDGKLSGEPSFDMDDEKAAAIAGKVERGFINAVSMGLLFEREHLVLEPTGRFLLSKCELVEVSFVAIPANANAVRLYVKDDAGNPKLMGDAEIKLCLSLADNSIKNTNDNNMKKIFLSAAALVALGLEKANQSDGIDENIVSDAINNMKQKSDATELKLSAAEAALKKYKDAEQATANAEVAAFLGAVIPAKYDETERETIEKMAKTDLAFAKKMADLVPVKKSLAGKVDNPDAPQAGAVKTMDDFQKLSLDAQLAFKKENPEAYKALA
jgi:hypothetical protein